MNRADNPGEEAGSSAPDQPPDAACASLPGARGLQDSPLAELLCASGPSADITAGSEQTRDLLQLLKLLEALNRWRTLLVCHPSAPAGTNSGSPLAA